MVGGFRSTLNSDWQLFDRENAIAASPNPVKLVCSIWDAPMWPVTTSSRFLGVFFQQTSVLMSARRPVHEIWRASDC
jgi:hypothetical protein